jgi:hypothetical protein
MLPGLIPSGVGTDGVRGWADEAAAANNITMKSTTRRILNS